MKQRSYTIFAILTAMSILSSCATTSSVSPITSKEKKIFQQGIVTGAAAGAVVGGVVGNQSSKKNRTRNTALGAALGAAIGGAVGHAVASQQVYKYRNRRLDNDELAAALKEAKNYNAQITSYNKRLGNEIAQLKTKSKSEQKKLAQAKLKEAKKMSGEVQAQITEREKLAKTLEPTQQKAYSGTLPALRGEHQKLKSEIATLEDVEGESARVG